VIERIRRLIQAAIGDLIEKARDPELELLRFIEQVEISLGEVRAEMEETQLRKDRLVEALADQRKIAMDWTRLAEEAVLADADVRAKECLLRRREADAEAATCEERLADLAKALKALEADRDALDCKLRQARLEQKKLSTELRTAESEKLSGISLSGGEEHASALDRMREEISKTEAVGEAIHEVKGRSLDDELAQLGAPSLDDELAELKKKVKEERASGAAQTGDDRR
jgi:phage shock protein A